MKWNAFSIFDEAIDRTKALLFPVKVRYWLKLGFVSLLTMRTGSGGGSNFNVPSSGRDTSGITGNAINEFGGLQKGVLGLILAIGLLIGLIFTYIKSVFSFIFIDALVNKEYTIRGSWRKNKSRGRSYFGFLIVASLISLAVLGLIFLPVILKMVELGFTGYLKQFTGLDLFFALLPYLVISGLWILVFSIFMVLVRDFALPEMYRGDVRAMEAVRRTFRNIRKQKLEVFVYLIAKLLFGICVAILSFFALILFGLIVVIAGAIIFVPLYFLSKVVFVILLIPAVIFVIYLLFVVLLPFTTFIMYYSLIGYEKLFGTKLLKKLK